MAKIFVLHVITGLGVGGAERSLQKLLKKDSEKFRFLVLSIVPIGKVGVELINSGIEVVSLDLKKSRPIPNFKNFLYVLRFNPTVIQGWLTHGNLFSLFLKIFFLKKSKLIWSFRQSLYTYSDFQKLEKFFLFILKKLSFYVDVATFNSLTSMDQHKNFGFKFNNIKVIPNGFKENPLSSFIEDEASKKKKFTVGTVARFHEDKNYEFLVDVCLKVLDFFDDIDFMFVGRGVDWNNPFFQKKIPQNRVKNFNLMGESMNVHKIYSRFSLYVSASKTEAFSNSIGEAMLSSVPCVVTDVGDSSFLLGEGGIVVPSGSLEQMLNAILTFYKMTSEDRKKIGNQGRIRIKEKFSLKKMQADFFNLYEEDALCAE